MVAVKPKAAIILGGNMAKKFEPVFESEIRRIVKNFNQKRSRAIDRGFSNVPEKQYVSRIKKNFNKRSDVASYLKGLQRFNDMGDKAFNTVETKAGGKISEYNYQMMKKNLKHARAFYREQIDEAEKLFDLDPYSIGRKDYLLNLEEKSKYLEQDILDLSQSGLSTFNKYIEQSMTSGIRQVGAYRGFLSGIDDIMSRLGYSKQEINSLYEKMADLTPAQFVKMYRQNDIIGRLYDLIPSPEHGKEAINLSDDRAKELIDSFLSRFDNMVEEAKNFGA